MTKEKELMDLIGSVGIDKVEAIRSLIEEGADINYLFPQEDQVENMWLGRTPLMNCITTGGITQSEEDLVVFELLTEHGVNIGIVDELGNTPVLIAVKYFDLIILNRLVQQGANIHDQNTAEENAFSIIIARYYEEVQDFGEDPQHGDGEAYERMKQRIDAIVKNGYDLSAGEYPAVAYLLDHIRDCGFPAQTLLYLFDKGVDPRGYIILSESASYPWLAAAFDNGVPLETLKAMISKVGVEYVFEKHHNFTPLLLAIQSQNVEVVKYLITSGADVHVQNDRSLRMACSKGNLEIVKCLIERGANMNATSKEGKNAIVIAENGGFTPVVEFLRSIVS